MEANKRHHIFGDPRHNLGALIRRCGGVDAAAEVLEATVQQTYERGAITADEDGRFREIFEVAGHSITVVGRIVGNEARIGTAWMS